ncbi:replication protein A 70 kDa DNA-binding subunit B [Tanacetum coccineum]
MVNKALRLSFLSNKKVEPCTDFNGSLYGFDFRGYKSITDLKQEKDGQFDVIGHVVTCEDLDNYDKNGKSGKKESANIGNMCVQNGYHATKLFLFNGTQPIVKEEFQVVKEYSLRSCRKKAIRSQDMIDLEADMPKKSASGKDDWFRLQIRVQDETGTMSLTLWNDEVQAVVDMSAYQLCDKYGKGEQNDQFPTEITALIGKKYAFKVSIDEYNVKKLLPMFTVLSLFNDPEILDSIRVSATPSKDLESLTDENTTPVNNKKNNAMDDVDKEDSSDGKNKRPTENDISNESSNGKKKAIEHAVNDDEPDECYCEIEAEQQKQWKLENEREARLEEYRKRAEDHWKELKAIRILKEDYVHKHELECDDQDNCHECFDYDDLHSTYPVEKSPKWNF